MNFTFALKLAIFAPGAKECGPIFLLRLYLPSYLSTDPFITYNYIFHALCKSTDLGWLHWYNSLPINCMWPIDLLHHLQEPYIEFSEDKRVASKITSNYCFLDIHILLQLEIIKDTIITSSSTELLLLSMIKWAFKGPNSSCI